MKSNTDTDEVRFYPKLFTADQAFNLSSQGTRRFYELTNSIMLTISCYPILHVQTMISKVNILRVQHSRADGSSKFSKDNRWGFFPSAALAWRMSSENFMESTKSWLDDLKLRISYGTAGNNNIPSDQTSTIWSAGSGASIGWMNNMSSYWTTGAQMANPDLKWETTHTRNAGLDFTLLNGKLSGTVEYYWNTTKDLLINFPVSGVGYSFQYRNLGETETKVGK